MKNFSKYVSMVVLGTMAFFGQSCTSSYSSEGYIPDGEENQNKEDYSEFAITPSLNLTSLLYATTKKPSATQQSLASKGKVNDEGEGPIDPAEKELFFKRYAKAKFYILAYRKSTFNNNHTVSGEPDYSPLMATDHERKNCLLSTDRASLDQPSQHIGKLALPKGARPDGYLDESLFRDGSLTLYDNVAFEDNNDRTEKVYYWAGKKLENVGYNFYAYYIDKAVMYGTERTTDRVGIDVQINGKNDMMVGMAPQVTDSLLRKDYAVSVTEDSIRANILKNGDGAYSTYSAVHSVEPRINLKHAMARICFRAVSEDEKARVSIADVKVLAPSRGKLVVAAKDSTELGLRDLSEEQELTLPYIPDGKDMEYQKPIELGEGIMIPPKDYYRVKVVVKQRDMKTDQTQSGELYETNWVEVRPKDGILAGNIYYVTLKVQGLKEVGIEVSMPEAWKNIGSGNVDMFDK